MKKGYFSVIITTSSILLGPTFAPGDRNIKTLIVQTGTAQSPASGAFAIRDPAIPPEHPDGRLPVWMGHVRSVTKG